MPIILCGTYDPSSAPPCMHPSPTHPQTHIPVHTLCTLCRPFALCPADGTCPWARCSCRSSLSRPRCPLSGPHSLACYAPYPVGRPSTALQLGQECIVVGACLPCSRCARSGADGAWEGLQGRPLPRCCLVSVMVSWQLQNSAGPSCASEPHTTQGAPDCSPVLSPIFLSWFRLPAASLPPL